MNPSIELNSDKQALYKKLENRQTAGVKAIFKRTPPKLLQELVHEIVITVDVPLYKDERSVYGTTGVSMKCWKNDPFGAKDLRTYLASEEGRIHQTLIIITPPRITPAAKKLAGAVDKTVVLLPLKELILFFFIWQGRYLENKQRHV